MGCQLPVLQDMPRLWGHAVDAPVSLPVLVADGDTEPAVVGPHDLNGLVLLALDEELLSLACVARLDGLLEVSWKCFQ